MLSRLLRALTEDNPRHADAHRLLLLERRLQASLAEVEQLKSRLAGITPKGGQA